MPVREITADDVARLQQSRQREAAKTGGLVASFLRVRETGADETTVDEVVDAHDRAYHQQHETPQLSAAAAPSALVAAPFDPADLLALGEALAAAESAYANAAAAVRFAQADLDAAAATLVERRQAFAVFARERML